MFQHRGISNYGGHHDGGNSNATNNCVKKQPKQINNNNSHTNQHLHHQSTTTASSFFKLLNPFSKSKSPSTITTKTTKLACSDIDKEIVKCDYSDENNDDDKKYKASVKVLKQFWNEQIKTAKSTENLYNRKSATFKYFSQSNDSINNFESQPNRVEKSLTLDGSLRLPLDDFNKFKDANFIRNKKIKLLNDTTATTSAPNVIKRSSRPESLTLNDSFFPQISISSSGGGKIHWAKREDIFTSSSKKSQIEAISSAKKANNSINEQVMSVKTNNRNRNSSADVSSSADRGGNSKKATRSDSVASSVGSINSSSSLNSANRKFSFKTNPSTTASYMNKKLASSTNGGSKVAQLAQRFNQMVQQDATILEEVKKRGTVVVHRSGGRVFKIKEEKVDKKKSLMANDNNDNASTMSDDTISLGGKNSTRRKSCLKKRPSIRIMVESRNKDGNGSVLSKRQLYETNIINKDTIVLKPRVPDKSERVLAKTKELKSKKMNEIFKTERLKNVNNLSKASSPNKSTSKNNASIDTSHITVANNLNNNELMDDDEENVKDTPLNSSPTATSSKNNLRKIYDKITFRPTFLYGKKVNKMTEIQEQQQVKSTILIDDHNNAETINDQINHKNEMPAEAAAAESNKTADNNHTNEIEDDLEFKPIDLNLNVYFNDENLSKTTTAVNDCDGDTGDGDENASSQGSINDVTSNKSILNEKPDDQHPLMKPNESFLFSRTLSATKFDTSTYGDTFSFIRNMLNSNENVDEENLAKIECNASEQENSYEIISRRDDDADNKKINISEWVDIDKNNNDGDNDLVRRDVEGEENIYQSLCEVKGNVSGDAISIKSYESFENYDEIKQNILDNKINLSDILKNTAITAVEDDYIFPDNSQPPELPAPRKNTIPKISSPILTSTTSNLVQANNLPVPKLQKSDSCTSTTYERIKYDQLPLKHQHSTLNVAELPLPPRNINTINNKASHQKYCENIYDTIKNNNNCDSRSIISTEYEKIPELMPLRDDTKNKKNDKRDEKEEMSMSDTFDINDNDNPYKNSKNDTMSIISNCYESISLKQSYSTINQILRHAISSTTLSSEHRINSIYGESIVGQSLSLTPPSDRSGVSDNSDEWIDVDSEDDEEEEEDAQNNDRFIV